MKTGNWGTSGWDPARSSGPRYNWAATELFLCLSGIVFVILGFTQPVTAQVSATNLSYYPLHVGDVWVYQISAFYPNPPNYRPEDTITLEIIKDTLATNGRRYAVFNTGTMVRVDSLSGKVYELLQSSFEKSDCPDSTEYELFNLTIDTAAGYSRCTAHLTSWYDTCTIVPLSAERVALLNVYRPQRIWYTSDFMGTEFRLAEGIGASFKGGEMFIGKQHELIYARIAGTEYFPVELRSFTASLLDNNAVVLQWKTENELQNHGFTVQRTEDPGARSGWIDITFVASAAEEGCGSDYEYSDHTAVTDCPGPMVCYRLRQQDYDGTVSYSPVVEVKLSAQPERPTLELYPNPAPSGSFLHLRVSVGIKGELQLFNALGQRMLIQQIDGDATISTDKLLPGVYFIRMTHANGAFFNTLLIR